MKVKDELADRHQFLAEDIVSSFDRWLSARLAEAYAHGKDFCFYDRPFSVSPGDPPVLAGWDHLFIEPGSSPPSGYLWTVYRLHGVGAKEQPDERRGAARA